MPVVDTVASIQQIQSRFTVLFGAPAPAPTPAVATPGATGFAAELQKASAPGGGQYLGEASGSAVVDEAMKYLGVPYVLGGTDSSGIDCSGLVQTVYRSLGIELPRLVSGQMTQGVEIPSLDQAKPGDLIVTGGGDHISIYAGDGMVIHAPYEGRTVSHQKLWVGDEGITTIRRIVPDAPPAAPVAAPTPAGLLAGSTPALASPLAGMAVAPGFTAEQIALVQSLLTGGLR